jgi:thiamine-phosphate pyrophosphorylase
MVAAVDVPVIGIGGIDTRNVAELGATGAAGAAVIRAIMAAPDPASAVMQILAAFSGRG